MSIRDNKPMIIVDVKDLVWGILSQWKAMVLFALVISLAVTALKYTNDINKYKTELDKKAATAEMASVPLEESISKIMESLSDEDRAGVEFLINQREWIDTETEYVNNSILLQIDPTSQKTLTLDYIISGVNGDNEELTSLVYSYSAYLKSEEVISSIRQIIDPDAENNYIAELLSVKNDDFNITYNEDATLIVRVVLPEEIPVDSIEQTISSHLTDYASKLKQSVCDHSIVLVQADVSYYYNSDAVKKRTDTMNSITALTNNANTMESALNAEQRAALNEIKRTKENYKAITTDTDIATNLESGIKPRISKKYILIGFLMGVLIYAFIFVLYEVLRNRVLSGNHIDNYVDGRVLGEIHCGGNKKNPLFYSGIIDALRYHKTKDVNEQIQKIQSTIDATCKHAGVNNISMFCIQNNEAELSTINKMAENLKKCGISSSVINIGEEIDEKLFLSVDNALCIISERCTVKNVTSIAQCFTYYGIRELGYIYIN